MTYVFYIIIALVVFDFVLERVLSLLNASYAHRPIPAEISDIYTEEKRDKQIKYDNAYRTLSWIINSFNLLISLLMLFVGYRWLDEWFHLWTAGITNPIWQNILMAILFFGILMVAGRVIHWPFELYSTFHIEKEFGFNKTTRATFWSDELKSIALSLLLTTIMTTIMTAIYSCIPNWFWLLAWGVVAAFSLFMNQFYSQLIVPIFNKQTPLQEGELRSAIEQFARETKFDIQDIYVLDSSKRSTHANAYFTGMGKRRRIVLYDTLIEQLTTEETVAVLAHEIGHNKHRHTLKQILLSLLSSLLLFVLLGLALQYNVCAAAIGCPPSYHVNMYLFSILYTPLSILVNLLQNAFTRRFEYQADAFVKEHGKAQALISSLKKMSANSLSDPTPHPAYVFFHYSHPTLVQRIQALEK